MPRTQTKFLSRIAGIAVLAIAIVGFQPGTGDAGPVSKGAAWGAVGGAVIGGIAGGRPLAGAAAGAATGAIVGKIRKESKK